MPLPKSDKDDHTLFLVEIIWHPKPDKTLTMFGAQIFKKIVIWSYNKVISPGMTFLDHDWFILNHVNNDKINENQWKKLS